MISYLSKRFPSEICDILCRSSENILKRPCNRIKIEDKRKIGAHDPIEPPAQIRLDNTRHWPITSKFHGTYRFPGCSSRVFTKCEKCNVFLCITNKLCFKLECIKKLAEISTKLTFTDAKLPVCSYMYNFNLFQFCFVTVE